MTTIDRRKFLSAAVLGGATVAGATALGSLAPEAAFGSRMTVLEPGATDPNFAEGRISGIKGSMLMVSGSDGVLHRIQVTNGTSIWKLRPTTFDQIEVGDGMYGRGVRMPDGTLAAESLWVNIVNLHGEITALGNGWLHLNHSGKRVVGHVVPGTTAAVYNGTPAVSDLSMLRIGKHISFIGAWRPDTSEVDIATVYARF